MGVCVAQGSALEGLLASGDDILLIGHAGRVLGGDASGQRGHVLVLHVLVDGGGGGLTRHNGGGDLNANMIKRQKRRGRGEKHTLVSPVILRML